MSETDRFSDEELVAYLDGEAEFAPIDAIKTALETDEDLQKRVKLLEFNQLAMLGTLNRFTETVSGQRALPECLNDDYALSSKQPISIAAYKQAKEKPAINEARFLFQGWQKIAAVALLSLTLGWGARTITSNNDLQNWHNYVAAYQALYSKETLASIDQSEDQFKTQLQRVASVLGKKIAMAQVNNIKGMEFKRAQILGYKGQPLVQLAFLSDEGRPVALCIIKAKRNEQTKVTHEVQQGLQAAHWKKGEYEYLLIGSNDAELIKSAASQFSTSL